MSEDDDGVKHSAEQDAIRAARFAEAKRKAIKMGKEPFDLDRVDELYPRGKMLWGFQPRHVRIERLEEEYYVSYPSLMTLSEFADALEQRDQFEGW